MTDGFTLGILAGATAVPVLLTLREIRRCKATLNTTDLLVDYGKFPSGGNEDERAS